MKSSGADPVTLVYHELRAPLGLMATAARSAAEDCDDEDLRKRVEMIVRAAERMLSTAASVLSLAAGSIPAPSETVSLNDVVDRIAEESRALGAPVFFSPGDTDCNVDVPLSQLETLIQSLLNNALQHGSEGEGALVQFSTYREGNCGIIAVKNRISTEKRHRGIGAGTYLANRIAAQFGGFVETCTQDEFFTASIVIPLSQPEE